MKLGDDENGGKPFYIPLFEIAGAAAIFGLLRRLDKAVADVALLRVYIIRLTIGLVGLSILTLMMGVLLWLSK